MVKSLVAIRDLGCAFVFASSWNVLYFVTQTILVLHHVLVGLLVIEAEKEVMFLQSRTRPPTNQREFSFDYRTKLVSVRVRTLRQP